MKKAPELILPSGQYLPKVNEQFLQLRDNYGVFTVRKNEDADDLAWQLRTISNAGHQIDAGWRVKKLK